ncbi:hypothetical protein, partial [Candidatus Ichthyocystis sparus]|uniref:hypothetical protein n=2 Tax=Candidatus Ichthyocystis sparus TaxID=1561004 RepID=UPI000B104AD6
NGELSTIGRAIWCRIYRELHLSSFIAKCMCIYHYKYRPDFVRTLPNVRVLSSSSDCKPVPLSGGVLLDFLSKLDCAAFNVVESVFKSRWDVEAGKVFSQLEGGSFSDVSYEDVISVLNIAGIPVVAFSYPKIQPKTGKSKVSGNGSGKVASGVTTLVSDATDFVCSSSSLQLQSELLYQPEPDSLPEGTRSSSYSPTETVTQGCLISESKTSEGSSKCVEGMESVSGTAALTHSPVISPAQLRSELLSQPESLPNPCPQSETQLRSLLLFDEKHDQSSRRFVKLLSCRDQPTNLSDPESLPNPCPQSETQLETHLRSLLLFDEKHDQSSRRFVKLLSYRDQPANLSDIVAVSTSDEPPSNYSSDFGALVGELSPVDLSPPSILFAPLSPSISELEPDSRPEPQYQYEMQLVPLSGECFSSISAHGSVSALEGDASDFGALVGELSPVDLSPPSILFAPLSQSTSEADTGYKYQYEMQLGSLFGECFSSISTHGSVSTLEGDASNLRVLEDGSSSSESRSAPKLCEDVYSPFVTQLVMGHLEESTGDSVVAGPSSSSPVSADMRGGRGGSSSSLQGGVQRRGRKRKRNE